MRRLTAIAFYVTLIAMSGLVFSETRTITIMGSVSCNEWVKKQSDFSKVDPYKILSFTHRIWLLGLLSGINAQWDTKRNLLEGVDSQLVFDWMDKFCQSHAEKDVYDGAKLFLETIEKLK